VAAKSRGGDSEDGMGMVMGDGTVAGNAIESGGNAIEDAGNSKTGGIAGTARRGGGIS